MAAVVQDVIVRGNDQTAAAFNSASRNAQRMGGTLRSTFRGMRGHTAQLGMQIQDIAVQLQGGTSAAIVFAQQGSQIASLFGPGGAVLGAFLAVGTAIAGTLIPGLLRGSSEAANFADEVVKLANGFDNLNEKTKQYVIDDLVASIAMLNLKVLEQQEKMARLNTEFDLGSTFASQLNLQTSLLSQAIEKLSTSPKEADKELQKMLITLKNQADLLNKYLNPELRETSKEMEAVAEAIAQINTFTTPATKALDELDGKSSAAAAETANLEDALDQAKIKAHEAAKGYKTVNLEHLEYLNNAPMVTDQTEIIGETMVKASNNAKLLAGSVKDVSYELSIMERSVLRGMEDALIDLTLGSKSVADAFKNMANSIIQDLARMYIRQQVTMPLFRMLSSAAGTSFQTLPGFTSVGGGGGSSASMAGIDALASGGLMRSGKPTIVGEKGPELVIPNRNGTVVPNDQLSGGYTINQTIQITTGVQQTVRTEIANMLPDIANATKAAVIDARRRGGSMARAFGG